MPSSHYETDVVAIRDRVRDHLKDGSCGLTKASTQAVRVLEDVVAIEVLRYVRHVQTAMTAARLNRSDVAVEFRDHAANELGHSIDVVRRLNQLGGCADFDAVTVIKRAHLPPAVSHELDLLAILAEDLAVECVVISCYHQIEQRLHPPDAATRRLLHSIGAEAHEHVGVVRQLLESAVPTSVTAAGSSRRGVMQWL